MNTVRHIRTIIILFALLMGATSEVWAQEPPTFSKANIIIDGGTRVGETDEYTIDHGSVTIKDVNAETRTVTLTVTPSAGYYIQKSDIVVQKLVDPANASAPRRVPEIADALTVSGPTMSKSAQDYTFVVPADYAGALVAVTFTAMEHATATVTPNTLVYTGEPQGLVTLGIVVGGAATNPVTYSLTGGDDYNTTIPTGTNAATYTVYYKVAPDEDHSEGSGSVTVVINKAPITSVELNSYVEKKTGSAITFSLKTTDPVKAGEASVPSSEYVVSGDDLTTQTEVGTYTCTVTAKPSSTNFTGLASVNFRIVEDNTVFIPEDNPSPSDLAGKYVLTQDISASVLAELYSTSEDFTGELDGNFHKITGLSGHGLFNTINGGIVKNVILEDVNITTGDPTNDDAGAICNIATGAARIYNCGILSTDVVYNDDGSVKTINATSGSKVSGTRYVGGLVGLLDGTARVINCYSYASITGGSHRAGIVGYNNYTSKYNDLKTMVMNCMFYGDISIGGTEIVPIYGGKEISNESSSRLNNYNYFVYEAPFSINNSTTTPIITKYNRALAAEERYLVRFEFYRNLVNSTRELASWYVFGSVQTDVHDKIAKWVLDPSIAPYPILKPQGYYPSVVNYDPDYTYDKNRNRISRYGISERAHGKHLGTLSVTINLGSGYPAGASITKGSLTLNRIDKDTLNYNFNYNKVQLPYYNDVGTGNYTKNKVVTGWKITGMKGGTQGSFSTSYDAPGYNFADRTTYAKDLFGESGRVFSQGAYFDVPDGVTGITIEPYWGFAAYLSDEGYDAYYTNSDDTWKRYNVNSTASIFGQRYTNATSTFNGDQPVYTSFTNALARLDDLGRTTLTSVYDYAVVLVGNYHHKGMPEGNNQGNTTKKHFTVMSVDFNYDNEPDYSLIIHSGKQEQMSPIRFDFINVPGAAMAHKITSYNYMGILGNMKFNGWFETTNTTNIHFSQFEYDSEYKSLAPLILMGGIVDMFTSTNGKEGATTHTTYIHIGGNVYFKLFNNGCHMDKTSTSTPHRPISVTGGDYKKFYLSGYLQPNAPAYTTEDGGQNAECYISGGRFGEVAGAGYEKIDGNVTWQIYDADMQSFFGGGINENKAITGNISTTIRDSYVKLFCGGPKFGNMTAEKTVTTNATNCEFGTYFGAGYGGTAITRVNAYNKFNTLNYAWNGTTESVEITPQFSGSGKTHSRGKYDSGKGISISYDYENFEGSSVNTVGYLFVNYASLSVAETNNVTSTLTGCTINQNFYGGGSLGAVLGDATSTLTNCTVHGSAYGAGFSASVPTASVFPAEGFKDPIPYYNSTTGVFEPGGGYPDAVPYTWSNDEGSNSNTLVDDGDNHYIHVDKATVDLSVLGTVSGIVTLTIDGKTIVEGRVFNDDGTENLGAEKGGVFGGGDESAALSDTQVNINATGLKDGAAYNVYNVFGGGNKGDVQGNTEVNMSAGIVNGNVFGGGKGVADSFECAKAMVGINGDGVDHPDGGTTVIISNGTVNGNVYGGGEVGRVEKNTVVTIGQGQSEPFIQGNVFGGGKGKETHGYSALVRGNATVTVQGLAKVGGSVYGGGEIASVGRFVVVDELPTRPLSGGTCTVTIQDQTKIGTSGTGHNVFGSCKGVEPSSSFVDGDKSFKCMKSYESAEKHPDGTRETAWDYYEEDHNYVWEYFADADAYHTFLNTLALASNTDVTIDGESTVNGSVYGGGQRGITLGDVEVNIPGGTITEDVYGGGALADTNKGNWNTTVNPNTWSDAGAKSALHTTAVTLTGGTIEGNVYGGGLGRIHRDAVAADPEHGIEAVSAVDGVEALTYGNVLLKLNDGVDDDATGCVVKGSLFGCNNLNGTPKGTVTVHVYKTQRAGKSRITNDGGVIDAKVPGTKDSNGDFVLNSFDVQAVYGGGNLAAYVPEDLANGKTQVIIDGCSRTSIGQVYGGGNAASTPATYVEVNGTFEIGELFGGGNGKDDLPNGDPNPGANVGYKDYHLVEDDPAFATKEARVEGDAFAAYRYGTGEATVNINGGRIHRVFGGSNTKGNVRKTALTILEEVEDNGDPICPLNVDEAYGGGKSAPMDAEAKLLMACIPGLKEVYGGAQAADINDDVTLNITNGTFDRVFGGNNLSGTIRGKITLNIEEVGCRPVIIGELYGGGNEAGYSVFGYKQMTEGTGGNAHLVWKPRISATDNIADGEHDDITIPYRDPEVNVRSFTSIGAVYGGGYGAGAVMVGNPTVNINVTKGDHAETLISDGAKIVGSSVKYEGDEGYSDSGYPIPSHVADAIGAISSVFGGGNSADVIGNTTVNIATQTGADEYMAIFIKENETLPALPEGESYYTRSGTVGNYTYTETDDTTAQSDTTYYKKYVVMGADIRGNIYGGGNNAAVTGNTNVVIGKQATP